MTIDWYIIKKRVTLAVTLQILLIMTGSSAVGQEASRSMLSDSPRHHEWVEVEYGGRTVDAFLVYPESNEKSHSIVVIHENRGLNDWIRTVADRLAAEGYLAIAPDLLSGSGPNGGRTSAFSSSDAAREAIYKLDPDQVTSDLRAVSKYVAGLPSADGTVSVAGFCWGGREAFRFATNYADLDRVFVFYGTAPASDEDLTRIKAPVFGFYGGNDERVNATIDQTSSQMNKLGKPYEAVVYDGAGHGFMRRGVLEDASDADAAAADAAWKRWMGLLK